VNLFIQGMRRSGTTILYDALCQDSRLETFYEPFAEGREGVLGGGSGVQPIDLFEKIRGLRKEFLAGWPDLDAGMLNYGAPTTPWLECEPDMPEFCRAYIRLMLSKGPHVAIKFTRMYCKIGVLKEINPDAALVIIVRDPRAVTASYLFGKDQRTRSAYPDEATFFSKRSAMNAWRVRDFSDHLLQQPQYAALGECEDFLRVLLVWKHTFLAALEGARRHYPGRALVLRHEDLQDTPVETMKRVYDHAGLAFPEPLAAWLRQNVRRGSAPYAADDSRWREAFRRLGLEETLELAGYAPAPGRSKSFLGLFRRK